jgi:hypothetical protein
VERTNLHSGFNGPGHLAKKPIKSSPFVDKPGRH